MKPHLFLLDNEDSFTYNLVDELRNLGYGLRIFRNNVPAEALISLIKQQARTSPVILILSPGPGTPGQAGCMMSVIRQLRGYVPILGICLGHQAIVQCYGGILGRADQVMHGKASLIEHTNKPPFENLPNPLPVARYHSLVAATVPQALTIGAQYKGVPMSVYHREDAMLGLQFHPESILSAQGTQLLKQSVELLLSQYPELSKSRESK